MVPIKLERQPPWFFQYIESYSHVLLDIKFHKCEKIKERLDFAIEVDLRGFEGLLFYIYRPSHNLLNFDIISHKEDFIHKLEDLYININNKASIQALDFIFIPFGHFTENNKFIPKIKSRYTEPTYQIFTWSPSLLFKKVKSIIKIDNKYTELIPLDDVYGYYYNFDISFKGNKTEYLFNLINVLCTFDNSPRYDSIVSEIKSLISKSNEYLFELYQTELPIEMQNLLRELERLKFNIDNLSKEEIFNWLDDLIDFYSRRTQE